MTPTTTITGRTGWFAGSRMTWHLASPDTQGTFALAEAIVRPGAEPPLHIHAREDETFYVLDGTVAFQRGNDRVTLSAGEAIHMPRGIQHGFAVTSDEARLLFALTPGGLEDAFLAHSTSDPGDVATAPDPDALRAVVAAFADHGVEFTGPPLSALLGDAGA